MEARSHGKPLNGLRLTAAIEPAGGRAEPPARELSQIAPGTYEADFSDVPASRALAVAVRLMPAGQRVWLGTVSGTYPAEFSATGAHWENLRHLAERCGGRIATWSEVLELAEGWLSRRSMPLWPYLLAAALGAMLAEWALARGRLGKPGKPNR